MTRDLLSPLDTHLHADRLKSRRLEGSVARLLVDASGMNALERKALEEDFRAAALALPGVEEVRIGMTAAKVERTFIAIASGKGGVGKSTLSANLAVALARLGHDVGLVDADIYGPSQPKLLGTSEKPKSEGKTLIPVEAHGVKMLSVGQLVEPGTALAWRGPMAAGALNQLLEADWGSARIVLIDLPPGTGDVQLSLISKARPAGALIVSTPQDLALIDAVRAIDLFRKTEVPVLGVIENMAGFACPHCGETSDPFGKGGAEASAKEMGLPFLGRLPLSASIRLASDQGTPPAADEGPAQDAFTDLARRLVEAIGSQTGG
ncbi:Mrp/NBP35 family ATP-binding protein [Sphingomicrobium arenosum]|uniref:Mrp/NBP35 family ATP-binding protein n=1 Tax=Sphingomicrobium arenosum TaxID=2233861 RepID=UPI00223FF33C|nr:Mrp/NBP35 family ATP-binding protein [Sphingomicrobium arenosum]